MPNKESYMLRSIIRIFTAVSISILIIFIIIAQPIATPQAKVIRAKYTKADNIEKSVYAMTGMFDDRSYNNTEILDKTAKYIYQELSKYSNSVEYQTYTISSDFDTSSREYKNIIADFKGTRGCNDEIIVIGAHYDTYKGYPGANDNTSAVAAILEVARLLKDYPPSCDTQIVAFSLEEPPYFGTEHMGSYIHAKSLHDKNKQVKLMVSLDMIGFYSDKENSQKYPMPVMSIFYPSKANFISIVSNLSLQNISAVRAAKGVFKSSSDLPVYSINAPSVVPGIDFSDHHNYWKFGYPAILITDTSFYRSDNYHTKKDTPDTLDYARLAKATEDIFMLTR